MKILFVTILFLAVVSAGCGSAATNSSPEGSVGSLNNSTIDPVSPNGDPREEVVAASKRFAELSSFRATMDIKGKQDSQFELDYSAPDRFHMKNGKLMEIIVIGNKTYIKSGSSWSKVESDLGQTIPNFRDSFTEEGLKNLQNVEYVGEVDVNGKASTVYKYNGKTPNIGSPFTSKIWIAKLDGLPVKIEVKYSSGDVRTMTTYYNTDERVTIEPPIK